MLVYRIAQAMCVGAIVGVTLVAVPRTAQPASPGRTLTIVTVEASGVKIWLPSTIAARAGERITVKLDNKLGAPHGFSIDDYGIHAVVPGAATQEVTFTAKKGVARFYCHLHPAHVGGNVIVL